MPKRENANDNSPKRLCANDDEYNFADDLLRGAAAIAEFLFDNPRKRRKAYHLASKSRLPTFKIGSMICARKSVLIAWVEQQEGRHVADVRIQKPALKRRA